MRLTEIQRSIITTEMHRIFGHDAQVWLFGSRVDDSIKGGDIDLMVVIPCVMDRPTLLAARLAAQLERRLEGRRVDVVLVTPDTLPQPIHRVAREQGILL